MAALWARSAAMADKAASGTPGHAPKTPGNGAAPRASSRLRTARRTASGEARGSGMRTCAAGAAKLASTSATSPAASSANDAPGLRFLPVAEQLAVPPSVRRHVDGLAAASAEGGAIWAPPSWPLLHPSPKAATASGRSGPSLVYHQGVKRFAYGPSAVRPTQGLMPHESCGAARAQGLRALGGDRSHVRGQRGARKWPCLGAPHTRDHVLMGPGVRRESALPRPPSARRRAPRRCVSRGRSPREHGATSPDPAVPLATPPTSHDRQK